MSFQGIVTPEQMESLQNAFDTFDSNSDNCLEPNELESALRALGFNPKKEEIQDMIEDTGNTPIDMKAFVYIVYHHSRNVDVEKELIDSFRVFDKEGTSKLPESKIREILKNIRKPLTDDEISEILNRAQSQNGYVNYVSFVHEMMNL
ncbi:EF hand family protein [Trichomonas vaginalis G3]|uniref:EF hand family protein n=1 Tax=Trichomonas vaginalis (strain ATCC PRA-98 / G3) TaxID=412133 RepID=A2DMA5_TRIV3|nr:calcium-binding protein family [Trichomonas vaginalis G3]EAY18525.1 EF hand family protein [Trichomonas vaginalis G3]KAI5489485.1 calcium-binding protein family [Trichomonas vaginalis G3]|eukprot:XP_001579511.1 EF hand family protein [Trichomonas vaginalis G3]